MDALAVRRAFEEARKPKCRYVLDNRKNEHVIPNDTWFEKEHFDAFITNPDIDPVSGFTKWFCSLPENKFLVEIDTMYMLDQFNYVNIKDHARFEYLKLKYRWEDGIKFMVCSGEPTEYDF